MRAASPPIAARRMGVETSPPKKNCRKDVPEVKMLNVRLL